jgi:hypothetical protein
MKQVAKKATKVKRTTVQKPTSLTPKRRVETGNGGYAYSDAVFAKALQAFREAGTVAEACRVANISRTAWYDRVGIDPAFQAAVMSATEDVTDELEQEAIRRAKDSSDTLIIFLLKSRRSSLYREKQEVTVVSPDVTRRLQNTVEVIGSRPEWRSEELLEQLNGIWTSNPTNK